MSIHPTAIVSHKAVIGANVQIGPFTVIYDNVSIGDETVIEGFCELGVSNHLSNDEDLIIGSNSHVRSHSIFYEGSVFGDKLVTGHRVTVREKTIAGKNLQIGTLSDIQGHCSIGDYVRLHSNVHIGQKSTIGNYVWLFPYVVLTNDPHPPSNVLKGVTVSDFAVIATMTVILPGVKVGVGCLIGSHSLLSKNAEDFMLYSGTPAEKVCRADKIRLQDGTRKKAYPWVNHFTRGYPEEMLEAWKQYETDS